MPAFVQVSPLTMKHILILDGWKMRREDEFTWLLKKGRKYIPVPRKCRTLPFAVIDQILTECEIGGRYLELMQQAKGPHCPVESDEGDQPAQKVQ